MYLCSLLPDSQYVRFEVKLIPQEIIDYYDLHDKIHNDYVYAWVKKVWYGLKEADKIAHDDLVVHLKQHVYYETTTPGYFRHESRPICFTLVVDDFGIKYVNEDYVQRLRQAIEAKYPVKFKMQPNQYIGINLKWNYTTRESICSMDNYIKGALQEIKHVFSKQQYYSPS